MRFIYHIARDIQVDYRSTKETCLRSRGRRTDSKRFARPCLPGPEVVGYLREGVMYARGQELGEDTLTLAHDAFAHFFDTWDGQRADVLHPVIASCKVFFPPCRMPGASMPQLSRRALNEILCLPGAGRLELGRDRILWDGPFGFMGMDGRVLRYQDQTKVVRSLHWGKGDYKDLPPKPLAHTSPVLSRVYSLQVNMGETPLPTLELQHSTLAHIPSEWDRVEKIINGKVHDDWID